MKFSILDLCRDTKADEKAQKAAKSKTITRIIEDRRRLGKEKLQLVRAKSC